MMPEFLDRLFGRTPTKKSGSMAKERLQFVLVHDRINLPPERMEAMKKEILAVISKYVSVDDENVDIACSSASATACWSPKSPSSKPSKASNSDDPDYHPNVPGRERHPE